MKSDPPSNSAITAQAIHTRCAALTGCVCSAGLISLGVVLQRVGDEILVYKSFRMLYIWYGELAPVQGTENS